jgi:hypothetical protein
MESKEVGSSWWTVTCSLTTRSRPRAPVKRRCGNIDLEMRETAGDIAGQVASQVVSGRLDDSR